MTFKKTEKAMNKLLKKYQSAEEDAILILELEPESINLNSILSKAEDIVSHVKVTNAVVTLYSPVIIEYDDDDDENPFGGCVTRDNKDPKLDLTIEVIFDNEDKIQAFQDKLEGNPLIGEPSEISVSEDRPEAKLHRFFRMSIDIDLSMMVLSQLSWLLNTGTKNN